MLQTLMERLFGERGNSDAWIMSQRWHQLLLAHWAVPVDDLRAAVPAPLEIDTFGGEAWLGIVAFRLSGVRLRGLPEIGLVSHFPEINVRTYVRHEGRGGVYFLSLDCDNTLAIALARPWFRLPYKRACTLMLPSEDGAIHFASSRTAPGRQDATFSATYRPFGKPYLAQPESLEHWLTERYSYFTVGRREQVWRCDVAHRQWKLQPAQAEIRVNTMAASHGVQLPRCAPLLHYADSMKARVWPVRRA